MIKEWRRIWFENTELKCEPDFPFGFVQLATREANNNNIGIPMIRWHQWSVHNDVQVFLITFPYFLFNVAKFFKFIIKIILLCCTWNFLTSISKI